MKITLPLRIRRYRDCYSIVDAADVAFAYIYFDDVDKRRSVTHRVSEDLALAIARQRARSLTNVPLADEIEDASEIASP